MTTYTVICLVDGQKIGGQSDATLKDVWDLVTDESGVDAIFINQLRGIAGRAVKVDRYKVWPEDTRDTVSVLVAYRNQ